LDFVVLGCRDFIATPFTVQKHSHAPDQLPQTTKLAKIVRIFSGTISQRRGQALPGPDFIAGHVVALADCSTTIRGVAITAFANCRLVAISGARDFDADRAMRFFAAASNGPA
jgi:hypothetical protein